MLAGVHCLWRRRVSGCAPALFCRGRKLYQQARMQWLACGSLKWGSWWQQAEESGPAKGAAATAWTLLVSYWPHPLAASLGVIRTLQPLLKKKINCLRKIMHHSEIEFWDSTQEGRVQVFFFFFSPVKSRERSWRWNYFQGWENYLDV